MVSAFTVTQALLPALIRARGRIANIVSIAALKPLPGKAAYPATQAAQAALFRCLPDDIAADGQARVNGYTGSKRDRAGNEIETIAPPFRLRDEPLHIGPAPEVGQHLEEVLLEHGYDWEEITSLRERGAF